MSRPTKIERLAIEHLARSSYSSSRSKAALGDAIEAAWPGAIARARKRYEAELDEGRFEGNPPAWARRMVRRWERSRVRLVWRRSRIKPWSSGRCYWTGKIIITANGAGDENEAKAVLAHELAHHRAIGMAHDDDFYDELYAIATAEGILRHVKERDVTSSVKRAASRARRRRAAV